MIIDCVPFFQERDIWQLRYETLREVVDGFVVIEARHTHSGADKPLTFVCPDDPAVRHYVVDLPDPGVSGIPATRRREMFQRNAIATCMQQMHCPDDAILLISDCDEIPRPDAVDSLRRRGLDDGEVVTLFQRLYYYNFNTTSPQPWPGTRAARWSDVRALSPHVIRCGLAQPDSYYPTRLGIHYAGWHLSYFGGVEQVARKMRAFLHQELVTDEVTRPEVIAARLNAGLDVWARDGNGHGFMLGPAQDVPPPVANNPARWSHLFHPSYAPTEAR